MNKTAKTILAAGLALAVATPALAEFKFNGLFRTMGYVQEKKVLGGDSEGNSQQFIDNRFRAKLTYSLNDNVNVVYFGEVDTPWGETGKAAAGQGGVSSGFGGGADGVNVETKNVFLNIKSGDTNTTLGIQGLADSFESIIFNDDMAGVSVTHKIGGTTLGAAYSKWDEDANNRSDWDDMDFYTLDLKHKFTDAFTAGAAVTYIDDNRNDSSVGIGEVVFYGLNAAAKLTDQFSIDGFVVMQDGSNSAMDYDYEGWAASAKAKMKIDNGDLGLRLIYFTAADDDDDNGIWQGFKGQYDFVNENQMQFLTDPYVANDGKERYATGESIGLGLGLMAVVVSGNHSLPDNMYVKWGAGYYWTDDEESDFTGVDADGDDLGYELCLRFGKKFFDKVDVSLNGSFADYGSAYDDSAEGGTDDPDSTYKSYLMVNVPF